MWNSAVPAEQRFIEIERGIIQAKIEVFYDPGSIQKKYLEVIGQARTEVILLLPSANSFHEQEKLGVIDLLSATARKGTVAIRIISPVDSEVEKRIAIEHGKSPIQFHRISPVGGDSVIIAVTDRTHSFVIEKIDDSTKDFMSAIGAATYSTRPAMVMSNVWLFEWLWNETGLVEEEMRGRIQVQTNALMSTIAWEITPANYRCARCGKKVDKEIRVYDPRTMPEQSEAVTLAMRQNNAGWIPFCFDCLSKHPYSKPSWLVTEPTE
ncbi:MAG: hypothetical protein OK455_02360 [Thaumarchaeota archaeon]|nr:hypothetical protein [Nitrososphaerota archaeon]